MRTRGSGGMGRGTQIRTGEMGKADRNEREYDKLLTLTEFAAIVNRTPATIYQWKRDGLLDGGLVYFPPPKNTLLGIRQSFVDTFGLTTGLIKGKP